MKEYVQETINLISDRDFREFQEFMYRNHYKYTIVEKELNQDGTITLTFRYLDFEEDEW